MSEGHLGDTLITSDELDHNPISNLITIPVETSLLHIFGIKSISTRHGLLRGALYFETLKKTDLPSLNSENTLRTNSHEQRVTS
jgi:hypothetical protein